MDHLQSLIYTAVTNSSVIQMGLKDCAVDCAFASHDSGVLEAFQRFQSAKETIMLVESKQVHVVSK